MTSPNFVLLYVDDPQTSSAFYQNLLGKGPVEASPNYVRFVLNPGCMLSLLSKHTAEPKVDFKGSSGELIFTVKTLSELKKTFEKWVYQRLEIIQPISSMYWGDTFTATDPDGHRLRAVVLAED